MTKTIVAYRACNGALDAVGIDRAVEQARRAATQFEVTRLVLDVPVADAAYDQLAQRPRRTPGWDVVAHLWDAPETPTDLLGRQFERVHAWRVSEHVVWDHDHADPCRETPEGVKQISFVGKRASITAEQFVGRYRAHGDLALVHHAGARRYEQNVVTESVHQGGQVFAISAFWFRSMNDLVDRYYAFDDSFSVTRADTDTFLDPATTSWRLVREVRIRG